MFVPVMWKDDDEIEADPETVTLTLPAGAQAESKVKDEEVLVILISGHTQNGANDNDQPGGVDTEDEKPSVTSGIAALETKVKNAGFKRTMSYSEDPGNDVDAPYEALNQNHCADNREKIVDDIKTQIALAKLKNTILRVAFIGYSHGGGLIDWVTEDLADPQKNPNHGFYSITFTAYIDAVDIPGKAPETDLPTGTAYHVNYYQSEHGEFEPWGGPTKPDPAIRWQDDLDEDNVTKARKDSIRHMQIDKNAGVHADIIKHIKLAHGRQP